MNLKLFSGKFHTKLWALQSKALLKITTLLLIVQMHRLVQIEWPPYQNRQQQSHVSTTEDGKEDSINHQQDVGGRQRGEQVDEATEDQVRLVVVVFMEQVPVCHPARDQLGDGLCDTYNRDGQVAFMNGWL